MKRKILVVAVISGLILLVGLSFQLGRAVNTNSAESAQHTSNLHDGGALNSDEEMDPNMPGMDHSDPDVPESDHSDPDVPGLDHSDPDVPGLAHSDPDVISEEVDRPLKATLGAFGVATSIILSGAIILKRRDEKQRELKVNARKNSGEVR